MVLWNLHFNKPAHNSDIGVPQNTGWETLLYKFIK